MRRHADAVAVDPDRAAAAPAAGRARAAIEPQHGAIVVVVIKAEPLRLLARVGHFQTEAINRPAIRRVLLHIPRLVVRKLDRRRDGGNRRELPIRRLRVIVAHVAHDFVALRLGRRHRVLIREGHRDEDHLHHAERGRRRGGEDPRDRNRPARAALGIEHRGERALVVAAAQIHDLLRRLDHGDVIRNGIRRRVARDDRLARHRANRDDLLRRIRPLACFEHAHRLVVHRKLIVHRHAIERVVPRAEHILRALAVHMRRVADAIGESRDAMRERRQRHRFTRRRHALVNVQIRAPVHALLELRKDRPRELLPHDHRHRHFERAPRIVLDELLENRTPRRREPHSLRRERRAFIRCGGNKAICPRGEVGDGFER